MYTYPPIPWHLGTPTPFPFLSNLIHPSLHRCGSTKRPLLASPRAPDLSKYRPSLTSIEHIRIRHGQLQGKDVAHIPYGNETCSTEFMGLAMERGEERENAWKLYAV